VDCGIICQALQKSFLLIPKRLKAASITGGYISVLPPWFLIGNCGPFFDPGELRRSKINSETLPRFFKETTPKSLSFFKNSFRDNGPLLDMRACISSMANLGYYPRGNECFVCSLFLDFRFEPEFLFQRIFAGINHFSQFFWCRPKQIFKIVVAESVIDLCVN